MENEVLESEEKEVESVEQVQKEVQGKEEAESGLQEAGRGGGGNPGNPEAGEPEEKEEKAVGGRKQAAGDETVNPSPADAVPPLRQGRLSEADYMRMGKDIADFSASHPDVNLEAVLKDEDFNSYARKRLPKQSLSEAYDSYSEGVRIGMKKAEAAYASKAMRSTGGGSASGAEVLTESEQAEVNEWNRRFPHIHITAKEFKERTNNL